MPNLVVGDIAQIKVRASMFGQRVITNFWYKLGVQGSSNDSITQLANLASSFKVSVLSPYKKMIAALSESWVPDAIWTQQLTPFRSVAVKLVVAGEMGLRPVGSTANVAYTVSKNGDTAGRSQLGAWHLPGVATDDMEDGFATAPEIVLLQAFADAAVVPFTATVLSAQWVPIIFHRNNPPTVPSTGTSIFQTTVRDTIRVMRRRTVNVGE